MIDSKEIVRIAVQLGDYIPVFQTLIWFILIVILLIAFHANINSILLSFSRKIDKGGIIKIGPVELGEDISRLRYVNPESVDSIETGDNGLKREEHRKQIYEKNDGFFLTHLLFPSRNKDQEYDIYIYIIGHKNRDLGDIEKAEFFFGHMWNNKIFIGSNENGIIGVRTSAYGPFLCTCCVKLKNGKEIVLDRYIDFEMGRVVKKIEMQRKGIEEI